MAHFAFIAPPLAGHWNPMAALAGELIARGHQASVVAIPGAQSMLRDPRIGVIDVGAAQPTLLAEVTARLAGQQGLRGLPTVLADMRRQFALLCADLPDALRAAGIDALVIDQLEPAGGLVARHLGLPYLSVANALPINRDPAVPPPFTGWSNHPGPLGRWRNRGGYRVNDLLLSGLGADISRQAAAWGLTARSLEDCLSPTAQIAQTVTAFDFPRLTPSTTLHQLGPLRPPAPATTQPDLPTGDGPLLFASLGTLQGGRADIFAAIAQAATQLGARLIIAHGGRLPPAAIAALPPDVMLRDFVDQRALLPHVHAVIGHAGLNTTMDSLAAGKPLVVIPFAFEQGAIAARLVRSGAGLRVAPGPVLARRLTTAIRAILLDPGFTRSAQTLATAISQAGGLSAAADIAESLLAQSSLSSAA